MSQDEQDLAGDLVLPGHPDMTPRLQRTAMPPKRATLIAQRIVQEIHEGRLSQGDPLPPEKDMLVAYGVGRNTLREALRVLELQGVITNRAWTYEPITPSRTVT